MNIKKIFAHNLVMIIVLQLRNVVKYLVTWFSEVQSYNIVQVRCPAVSGSAKYGHLGSLQCYTPMYLLSL